MFNNSNEEIAQVCHEANRAVCEAFGDYSQVPWASAPDWQKNSAVEGVVTVEDNPDQTPEMQHDAWCQAKINDGWVYGAEKDAEKKTHPCLVPYAELPGFQRAKDYVFTAIAKTMLWG